MLGVNDRCEGRVFHWTDEVLDVHLTPPSSKRKSADTHSSNDAAGAQPRGGDKLVLLFPVLSRFVECGLTAVLFLMPILNAHSVSQFCRIPFDIGDRRQAKKKCDKHCKGERKCDKQTYSGS